MPKSKINNIFNCNDLTHFIESIKQILPHHGFSESKFFICEIDDIEFLTKLSLNKLSPAEMYDPKNAEQFMSGQDIEIEILKLLKDEVVYKNRSPSILELIYYKKCNDGTAINKIVGKD